MDDADTPAEPESAMLVHKDVRGGTSGTSRDMPIFIQFHDKIRTVDEDFIK